VKKHADLVGAAVLIVTVVPTPRSDETSPLSMSGTDSIRTLPGPVVGAPRMSVAFAILKRLGVPLME